MKRLIIALSVLAALLAPWLVPRDDAMAADPCFQATRSERKDPDSGSTWVIPSGTWRAVNFWSNMPGVTQGSRKLLLAPDQYVELMGAGEMWSWPAQCESAARQGYASTRLPAVSASELGAEALCCGREIVAYWQAVMAQAAASEPAWEPPPLAIEVVEPCPDPRTTTINWDRPANVTIPAPAIVLPWWPNAKPSFAKAQVKTKVEQGSVTFLEMAGVILQYAQIPSCFDAMARRFDSEPLPAVWLDQFTREGLVRAPPPPPTPTPDPRIPSVTIEQVTQPSCQFEKSTREAKKDAVWEIRGDRFKVIAFWSNQTEPNLPDRKLFLRPDQNPNLLGGGTMYSFPKECENAAREWFTSTKLDEITLDQLRQKGLVK